MNDDLFSWNNGGHASRADQITERFEKFFLENLHVWKLFLRFTFEAINRGFNNYSASAVFERMRWHVAMETRSEDGLKLSNDFRAYYARMFHVAYPKHDGFFRNRKRRSEDQPPFKSEPGIDFTPPSQTENSLMERLKLLLGKIPK